MTIMTAMVSPIARPTARPADIRMFRAEAGRTIPAAASHFEMPRAIADGRQRVRAFSMVSLLAEMR